MKKPIRPYRVVAILDNIRSAHNVGSMFRTADALGIEKLYLCGTTPTPTDRFGRARKDIAKVALGAEKHILWEKTETTHQAIRALKKEKFKIIAIEQDKKSKPLGKIKPGKKFALVLGNEVGGIDKTVLALADTTLEIPMHGEKESLNVAVAFGIAGYTLIHI